MKGFKIIAALLLALILFVGCNNASLRDGYFYLTSDSKTGCTPYVHINTSDNIITIGEGTLLSYAEIGSYAIDGHNIKATTDTATFVFKIQDESTLILVENSSGFDIPIDSFFRFNEELL